MVGREPGSYQEFPNHMVVLSFPFIIMRDSANQSSFGFMITFPMVVCGLEHCFTVEVIFFRGVGIPLTRSIFIYIYVLVHLWP